ncbi:MAG TPA: ATP-dependent Clp protease adaptor ClpS [Nitrospirae bacterium]|nr:ATP-dependent Clp protease adaptor ClpS [Nitrospirota bacterium]
MSTETVPFEKTASFVIEPWNVILLNDDWHTFDEVIVQLMKATGCSSEQAAETAWLAHTQGEAVCYTGPRERCEHVASVLEEIELGVRLERA